MFEFKPDYEDVAKRYDAWWDCEVLDRPLVSIYLGKPESEQIPVPEKTHATLRERWLDFDYQVERACAEVANTIHYADALPVRYPNLGPEIFAAFYGCELEFGEMTSWSKPILESWDAADVDKIKLDVNSFYFKKIMELTDAFIEVARNKFIVGYTDLHPGGDAIAAFRDPQQLCMDILFHGAEIKSLSERLTNDYFTVYDLFHAKLSAAHMPSTSWLPGICKGRYHIPSNDFACMIADDMFEEIFLPGIERECAYMDRNIYHLDGPNALRYLDRLMDIPNLHAIQWVPGAGREDWHDWIDVYRRIQARKKAFTLYLPVADLDEFMERLRPEGAWLTLTGVANQDQADAALKKLQRWGVH